MKIILNILLVFLMSSPIFSQNGTYKYVDGIVKWVLSDLDGNIIKTVPLSNEGSLIIYNEFFDSYKISIYNSFDNTMMRVTYSYSYTNQKGEKIYNADFDDENNKTNYIIDSLDKNGDLIIISTKWTETNGLKIVLSTIFHNFKKEE